MPTLYLETTIVSYLTALPSHNLVRAAHQQVTRDWWETRSAFNLYVSQFVIDEAGAGDAEAAQRRLGALAGIPLLDLTPDVGLIAGEILRLGGMPAKAYVDAVHVAVAGAHGIDYLLTWNCTHIANPMLRGKVEAICRATGCSCPRKIRRSRGHLTHVPPGERLRQGPNPSAGTRVRSASPCSSATGSGSNSRVGRTKGSPESPQCHGGFRVPRSRL
jgi:predicted nucleic acid-binding protein